VNSRGILTIAASLALWASLLVTPAVAGNPAASSAGGPGRDCPGIVWGDGIYYDAAVDPDLPAGASRVWFYMWVGDLASGSDTPTASCHQSWYTIVFLPTDAGGNVLSAVPVFSQTWKGDGKTNEYVAEHAFTTTKPAGLCVFATSRIGSNVIHYAPSGVNACMYLQLDPDSSPGRTFRG
jgi:hypothetical protein